MSENNNLNSEDLVQGKNPSLAEIKKLQEMPNAKPVCLVDKFGCIVFCNKIFSQLFNVSEGDSFESINSEPSLPFLFQNFANSQFANFHFDFHYFKTLPTEQMGFIVDIEKVLIDKSYLFLLVFTSNEVTQSIEERIK